MVLIPSLSKDEDRAPSMNVDTPQAGAVAAIVARGRARA
jgi:hypothetical protein